MGCKMGVDISRASGAASLERSQTMSRGVRVNNATDGCSLSMARDSDRGGSVQRPPADYGVCPLESSKLKRILDIFGACVGIFLLSPLLILTALAIVIESPGSSLFRQRRSGHRGA